MTISRVQATGNASAGNVASLTATYGTQPTQGNLLVAAGNSDGVLTMNSSGWSQAFQALAGQDCKCWFKFAGAGESTSVQISPSASTSVAMNIAEYSSTTGWAASPLDQTATTTAGAGTTCATGTTATTTQAEELLIVAGGPHDGSGAGGGYAFSSWSNSFTSVDTRNGSGSASHASCYLGERMVAATATYTSTLTWTTTATDAGAGIATFKTGPAAGTLSHDTDTRFPVTDGTSTATGDQTFSHVGAADADGAVVQVYGTGTAAHVTGVLYGGTAMALVEEATDTVETGRLSIYVLHGLQALGLGGTQTVTLQGCTAVAKWALASTVLVEGAGWTTQGVGNNHVNTTTSTNPTVTVTTSAEALLYGGVHGGAAAPTSYAVGSGYTLAEDQDYGALSSRAQRRTSPVASGNITFNFTFGTSDDWCIAAVALGALAPAAAAIRPVRPRLVQPMFRASRW